MNWGEEGGGRNLYLWIVRLNGGAQSRLPDPGLVVVEGQKPIFFSKRGHLPPSRSNLDPLPQARFFADRHRCSPRAQWGFRLEGPF